MKTTKSPDRTAIDRPKNPDSGLIANLHATAAPFWPPGSTEWSRSNAAKLREKNGMNFAIIDDIDANDANARPLPAPGFAPIIETIAKEEVIGGNPLYAAIDIATKRDHFLRGAVRYDLFPGMEVSTSIHTGERTVMEYLLDPFLNARGEALRER